MITMETIAGWFGGTIPVWFWIVVAIGFIVFAVIFLPQTDGNRPEQGQLKMGRNSDCTYYAYYDISGEAVFTGTKEEVIAFIAEMV